MSTIGVEVAGLALGAEIHARVALLTVSVRRGVFQPAEEDVEFEAGRLFVDLCDPGFGALGELVGYSEVGKSTAHDHLTALEISGYVINI